MAGGAVTAQGCSYRHHERDADRRADEDRRVSVEDQPPDHEAHEHGEDHLRLRASRASTPGLLVVYGYRCRMVDARDERERDVVQRRQ